MKTSTTEKFFLSATGRCIVSVFGIAALSAGPAFAQAEALSHDTAPALTDAELGHLRNFVSLARQDLGDWSGWEAQNQKDMEAYRYQISFMAYALAFQQYHSVPAYRDLYQDTLNRLTERMIQKPVWDFWEEVSMSSPAHDPDWEGPVPGWRDPVAKKNIMYSGHILHMVSLYEMLYRDFRWSEPGAITFEWNSDERYVYDMGLLSQIVHDEMMTPQRGAHSRDVGAMECEPNAVFPECNQHPTLAFMLRDRVQGTDLSTDVRKAFRNFFDDTDMYHPETRHAEAFYRIKQDNLLKLPGTRGSASADGWTGAFMHGWDPAYIESMYEKQRNDYVGTDEKSGEVSLTPGFANELGLGFFANLAMEVGDVDTANLLFKYADAHLGPVWEDGALHYRRNMNGLGTKVSNTSDKLIGMARSNRPDGIHKIHNEPWTESAFSHPLLEKVDFPDVLVRQAVWDPQTRRLLFTLEPGNEAPVTAKFGLANLDPERAYRLTGADGEIATIRGQKEASLNVGLSGAGRFTLTEM